MKKILTLFVECWFLLFMAALIVFVIVVSVAGTRNNMAISDLVKERTLNCVEHHKHLVVGSSVLGADALSRTVKKYVNERSYYKEWSRDPHRSYRNYDVISNCYRQLREKVKPRTSS